MRLLGETGTTNSVLTTFTLKPRPESALYVPYSLGSSLKCVVRQLVAADWIDKAAAGGDAVGMRLLGKKGTTESVSRQSQCQNLALTAVYVPYASLKCVFRQLVAADWIGKAAEGGDAVGMRLLGVMTLDGYRRVSKTKVVRDVSPPPEFMYMQRIDLCTYC